MGEEAADHRHDYSLEEFRPGIICHVDSLNYFDETLFTRCSQYLDPPFDVAHGGGIFQSKTMSTKDPIAKKLVSLNTKVLSAFGLRHGASHSEYIVRDGGKEILFLKLLPVAAEPISLIWWKLPAESAWDEWANIEHAVLTGKKYHLPMVANAGGNCGNAQ
jgi:hypothetical protein